MEFDIKNTIPFTLLPPKMKHLDTNLYDLYLDLYDLVYKKTTKL